MPKLNKLKILVLFICLIVVPRPAFSQKNQSEKDVLEALKDFGNEDYSKSVPILEQYLDNKELENIFNLAITIDLHSYYMSNQREKFDILKINCTVDQYIKQNKIGSTKKQNIDELWLLYFSAILNKVAGNYNKQLEYLSVLKKYYEEIKNVKNQDYFAVVLDLAENYFQKADYQRSKELYEDFIPGAMEVLGERNPDYMRSLNIFAQVYLRLGDYKRALEINQVVVNLKMEVLGVCHPEYLLSLGNLASTYLYLGNYRKALEISQKVVDLGKEVLGDRDPNYLNYLSNLSVAYSSLGDNKTAITIDQKVVKLQKEILGSCHPDYLLSLSNLAFDYFSFGDYNSSLELNQEVVDLQKEILGEHHPDYLNSLNNLGILFLKLGNYKKALEINFEVTGLRKEILGERHPDYLRSLCSLALVYSRIGDYDKSIEINAKVVYLQKEILGDHHPDYLMSLNNLAQDFSDHKDYNIALEMYILVVDLHKEVFGDHHSNYLTSLNNLGQVYFDLGDSSEALEIFKKVVDMRKDVLGESNPEYLTSLCLLSGTELYLSKFDSAFIHFQKMITKTKSRVIDYFAGMTELQREMVWEQNKYDFELFPLLIEKVTTKHSHEIGDVYDVVLFSKGLLLNTTLNFDQLIAEKGTSEALAKFEELKLIKLQIQCLWEKPIAERYLNVDSLENIAQKKETELVKLSKEYGDYTRNLKINWKDVQSRLGEKDVAIEFVEYPTLTDTVKYAALVLRKGWPNPRMISLFRKDQIEEFIKQDKDKIYSNGYVGKQLKKLIWEPLEAVVLPGDRIYFSASGVIHQIAIENLPSNDTQTLGDLYEMHRLSSTKELAMNKPEVKRTSAVLYGGLKYDLSEDMMAAESKKYEKKENLYAMRGYQKDTTLRNGWNYLEGTLTEVEQINRLMNDKKYHISLYTGESGNEESFKSLSGKREGIIHIATHGFFLPIEDSRKNLFMQQRMGDQQQGKITADPMLRSGLMLSGGNRAWQGEIVSEDIEDGVLTAKEISRMDLRGTDLVVLSACETGLGEVSSEGVFGLQRAFKQAGVQTLVMSLWEVSDKATNFMMTQFYTNLLSGKEKRAAFLEAKKSCREMYPEPQYWAAFILLD